MSIDTGDIVRDLDFHPHEPTVRVFEIPRADVPRLDDDAFVTETRHGDVVLRHYAFADEWFKVNVTLDRHAQIVESAPGSDHPAFAFNCDIATPMRRTGRDVFAVDLYADVLVRADGRSYHVKDETELEATSRSGLVSTHELESARAGLARLLSLIDTDKLVPFLEATCLFGPSDAPEGRPMTRLALVNVPDVQPERRWSWHPTHPALYP